MKPSQKYTRSSVKTRKTGDKTWYQALAHYKKPDGKWDASTRKIPSEIAKKGVKARKKFADEFMDEMNAKTIESPVVELDPQDTRTVDEVVRGYLDYQLSIGSIEEGTHYRQLSHYDKHISPIIGDYGFRTLNRVIVMDMYDKLNAAGLKQDAIYHYAKIPCKVYNYYLSIGEVAVNPFNQVKKAKRSYKENITHLTQEQTEALFAALNEEYEPYSQMYTVIMLVFYAGLRRGEVCGLRWRNIDFKTGNITIDTAIATTKGKTYPKLPKNNSSFRTFPIVPQLLDYLSALKAKEQPEQHWFVVGNKEKWLSPHMFTANFGAFRDKYDLTDAYNNKVIPHGIRHNFAAVGIRAKMDIASLSEMMGHSSMAMTLDVYGDSTEQAKRASASALGNQFSRDTGSHTG